MSSEPKFRFGPYVPILRSEQRLVVDTNGVVDYYSDKDLLAKKLLGEILPDDSIVDAPSMVVPLLLKKKTLWPPRVVDDVSMNQESRVDDIDRDVELLNRGDDFEGDDDIQLVKIIDRSESKCNSTMKRRRNKDFIRAAVVQSLSNNNTTTLSIPDYFESSTNDLLLSIGLSQVQEFVTEDSLRRLSSKIKRGSVHLMPDAEKLKEQLKRARASNRPYKSARIHRCPHCPFRTESRYIIDGHLEKLHKLKNQFICNWCSFRTKDKDQIIYHTYVVHRKRSHLEKPIPTHCCRYCNFESNSKLKYSRHIFKCEIEFNSGSSLTLAKLDDFSAITPKFITQNDIRAYESVLKDLRLAAYNPHQIEVMAHNSQNSVFLIPRGIVNIRPNTQQASINQLSSPFTSSSASLTPKASSLLNNAPNQMHQIAHSLMAASATSNKFPINKGAVLQHPKPTSAFTNGIFAVKNAENVVMAPPHSISQNMNQQKNLETSIRAKKSATLNNRSKDCSIITIDDQEEEQDNKKIPNDSFVICEICDAYIEEFSEFRVHMFEVHQVKIQHRPGSSRPPLSCQKCQWRFFTDQGLERHLLGSHGLVTTSMQDKADKQTDSGRCTICGRKFPRNLVAHMKDSHKISLKPAQLSYKCKVCSATYGLYSHFEKHVFQLHSQSQINR